MRELLILLVVLPVALLTVVNQQLATFQVPLPRATPVVVRVPIPTAVPASVPSFAGDLLAAARSWLGTPYQWGGCTRRGTDCSCFVRNVLAVIGINAPRTTVDQVRWARPVARDQLTIGDLVFFDNTCSGCGANPTHVAMFIGAAQMIEAGDPVQLASLDAPFWRSHFASAGHPPGL